MATTDFSGLGVALVTPFKQNYSIDYEALVRVLDGMLLPAPSVDYILVMGTTAETPTLSTSERAELKDFVKRHVAGRVPLVLGVGGNCTSDVVATLTPEYIEGFSAILSVVPYYNKPNQRGMYAHFSAIAEASPLPIILYNIPGRTGVNMLPETIIKLARDHNNIVAVKEASGNVPQITELIENAPTDFSVISGDDGLTYDLMCKGAKGVISVIANAHPKELYRMTHLLLDGKHDEAKVINQRLARIDKLIFADGNPAGIKCLMHDMGLLENVLRLPLVPVCPEVEAKIRSEEGKL